MHPTSSSDRRKIMGFDRRASRAAMLVGVVGVVGGGACFSGGGSAGADNASGEATGSWDVSYVSDGGRRSASVDLVGDTGLYRYVTRRRMDCYDPARGIVGWDLVASYAVTFQLSPDGATIDVTSTRSDDTSAAPTNCRFDPPPQTRSYRLVRETTASSSFGRLGGPWRLERRDDECTFTLRGSRITGACRGIYGFDSSSFDLSLSLVDGMLSGTLASGEVVARRQ